jgi:c(7)-type cytochrome triheme protein
MDFRFTLSKFRPLLFFSGILILSLPWYITAGCVQQVKNEELLGSGAVDPEGHPLAFRVLPKTHRTGYVDWVAALKQGVVQPKESLDSEVLPSSPLNLDIIFKTSHAYPIPDVVFPHAPHTLWLDCNNCHPALFVMKQGANPVSMDRIIKGEFCGRCHGTVAFPIADCFRCHSRPKEK